MAEAPHLGPMTADATPEDRSVSEKSSQQRTELENIVADAIHNVQLWCEQVLATVRPASATLQVVVDRTDGSEGIDLEELGKATEAVSTALDAVGDVLPELGSEAYQLEVTSPGVSRPLHTVHQFRRNIGRLISVNIPEADTVKTVTARLQELTEDSAANTAEVELVVVTPGAKKGMPSKFSKPQWYPLSDLSHVVVQVE